MDSLQNIKACRRKINPIYLWYSIILFFPPIHEWGHVIIAKLIGETVTEMHWNYVMIVPNSYDFIQDWWEYSPFIASGCVILWGYLFIRNLKANDLIFKQGLTDEA